MSIRYTFKQSGVLLTLLFVISGCSSPSKNGQHQQAIDAAKAIYASNAIRLEITSEPQMNAFNNLANSVTVIIAQAHGREPLDKFMANPVLLRSLFNRTGVTEGLLQFDSYVMMPGQSVSLHIDRVERANYVAVIAGYYPAPDLTHSRIYPLPIGLTQEGLWHKRWLAEYIPLRIFLTLGRQTIVRSEVFAGEKGDDVVYYGQQTATEDNGGKASWPAINQGLQVLESMGSTVPMLQVPAVADAD
ncbi:hypothetical protein SME10J_41360 [Serratia marcescens]|nr:hypothetical protein SME10J_41360 [Serratia marcescens]